MATQDVEVMVAMPPSGLVLVMVVGIALDVVMCPMVMVLRVEIGRVGSGSGFSANAVSQIIPRCTVCFTFRMDHTGGKMEGWIEKL